VLLSLAAFAVEALETRTVSHPAIIDLMARELLDFPLSEGSLCRFCTRTDLSTRSARALGVDILVPAKSEERIARFARTGTDFYQPRVAVLRTTLPEESRHG
jgi:hypothetical protein